MPLSKKYIGLFLFVALVFTNVSAFHVLSHQEADAFSLENCSVCELVTENQLSDACLSDMQIVDVIEFIPIPHCEKFKVESTYSPEIYHQILSRPPPVSLA